jgi:hypothetical protein
MPTQQPLQGSSAAARPTPQLHAQHTRGVHARANSTGVCADSAHYKKRLLADSTLANLLLTAHPGHKCNSRIIGSSVVLSTTHQQNGHLPVAYSETMSTALRRLSPNSYLLACATLRNTSRVLKRVRGAGQNQEDHKTHNSPVNKHSVWICPPHNCAHADAHSLCTAAATVKCYRWVATAQQTFPSVVLASKLKAGLAAAVSDNILHQSEFCSTPLVSRLPAPPAQQAQHSTPQHSSRGKGRPHMEAKHCMCCCT